MHEMSIAEGILDIALETMKNNDASIVHSVQLDLGLMHSYSAGMPLQRKRRQSIQKSIFIRFLLKGNA